MKFVKMHGCGNDYVYLDGVTEGGVLRRMEDAGWAEVVRRMSDRHKGVGSDGVIVVCPPSESGARGGAHVRMRMFNSDGSESEMCGNGVRCVAKFSHDRLGVRANPMLVETGRGVLSIACEVVGGKVVRATVDMGEPILELGRVPVGEGVLQRAGKGFSIGGSTAARDWQFVSMGNPHAVSFEAARGLGYAQALELLRTLGPSIETHRAFPNRTNVHLVQRVGASHAKVYTWERGAGITQACGTGICASLVAGVMAGHLDREATMTALGGDLRIRWDERTNHVFMTGEAVDVFEGIWEEVSGQSGGMTPPVLRTERLILRAFTMEDAPAVARLAGDKRIAATTLLIPHPYELHHAREWIGGQARARAEGRDNVFAVCDGVTGEIVGAIGLNAAPLHGRAELGYWIGVPFWGRGYATEASRALVRHGFVDLKLARIFACHYMANPASGRVLEKIGMKQEGFSPKHVVRFGVTHDVVHFGMVREDWLAANGGA